MQVELIRFRKNILTLLTFSLANRGMTYCSPNPILGSCGVYFHSTDTIGGLTSTKGSRRLDIN